LKKAAKCGASDIWLYKSLPKWLSLPPSHEVFPPPQVPRPLLIALCIQLTITCAVSFRSVPKILAAFKPLLQFLGLREELHIPHFTTVIRWTLRVGAFLLTTAVTQPLGPWICIIDHTIQVGTKKALVVLKVPIKALNTLGALTLKDVDVLSITVQKTWNGPRVQEVLQPLFSCVGVPLQVVVDGGPDLNKGLRLLLSSSHFFFKVTSDITHFIANILKRKYQHHDTFTSLLAHLAQTKHKILQTSFAYLVPLKERSKSRFLNLPAIAKYTKQIITYLKALPPPSEHDQTERETLSSTFAWLSDYHEFLDAFWTEIQVLSDIQQFIKTTGLHDVSYQKACTQLQRITDAEVKDPLLEYLKTEFEFATQASHPILLTSDSIESLFGKYKYLAKPHCLSEVNRMILSLPCICRDMSPELVQEAFAHLTNKEVEQWCRQEISETLLSKRRKAFRCPSQEKNFETQIIPFPNQRAPALSPPQNIMGQKQYEAR
jgi:hypothetical protein